MPRIFRFTLTEQEFDHLLGLLEDHDDPLVLRLRARQLMARSRKLLEGDRAQQPPVTETRTKNQTGVQ